MGVLKEVKESGFPVKLAISDRVIFVVMEYRHRDYMGCLLFDDAGFCARVRALLEGHCGHPIADIGALDAGNTF